MKKLPWRGGVGRPNEDVRPIFWSHRMSSYLARTSQWDEYPNGRWGDLRSPAYGELTDYYLASKRPRRDNLAMWGVPNAPEDVNAVFEGYIAGDVLKLPWSEQPLEQESSVIKKNLRLLNRHGFLTINR